MLEKDWQMLQSCLKDYSNISCTLVAVCHEKCCLLAVIMFGYVNLCLIQCISHYGQNDCGMTVSIARSIGDSDIVGKAWDLLRLMAATKVPVLVVGIVILCYGYLLYINDLFYKFK